MPKSIPTPADAQKFLDLFFDLDFVNEKIVEEDDGFGLKLRTVKMKCVIPEKNARKYYHATLYEKGYICHYGRMNEYHEPAGQQVFKKTFPRSHTARAQFQKKVDSKLWPPSGKDRYELVSEEDFE